MFPINTAGLSTGTYNGTVLVAGSGGAPGSTTVNVTLNVTAPLPTITKVTNAASYATGAIAPGEIITLFAGDPTHPIGPATPAGLTLDTNGKVATTIGGVQVLINGFASPMIYASASQVSAVVPYELKLFTTATISIRFLGQTSNFVSTNVTTTSPGLFTANSSGTGPGAIANSNGSINSPSNPATRGDIVVVYLTGEGETSPAGVTGKVTTVAAPPQPLTPAPLLPVSITVGGQGANYTFAGEAPGFVSGVLQLNLVLPDQHRGRRSTHRSYHRRQSEPAGRDGLREVTSIYVPHSVNQGPAESRRSHPSSTPSPLNFSTSIVPTRAWL